MADPALSLPRSDSALQRPLVSETTGTLTTSAPAHAVLDLGPARAGAKPVTVLPGRGEDLSGEAVTDAKRPLWWKGPNLTFGGGEARRAHVPRARTGSLVAAALQ